MRVKDVLQVASSVITLLAFLAMFIGSFGVVWAENWYVFLKITITGLVLAFVSGAITVGLDWQ